ncbi:hypothetical protein SDC9_145140 [bioreactor metagenome]|uniref:Uncharacterized protein n=1 Tax=bioreactor metagenome TaxID=1076179 RepID=A0A645E972_9ZZZZ
MARQGRILNPLLDVEIIGSEPVRLREDVFALRVAQVEPFRQIHQEDDRELESFAGMDGHDSDGILIVAEGGRLGQILVALLDLLDEADELEQPFVVRFLVFLGPLIECVQIGCPLLAGDHAADIIQEVGVVVDGPDQRNEAAPSGRVAPFEQAAHEQRQFAVRILYFRSLLDSGSFAYFDEMLHSFVEIAVLLLDADQRQLLLVQTDDRRTQDCR